MAGYSLLYSTDRGETWNESRIRQSGYAANPFLSVTDSGYYVTMAADRSLGSDYYATYYSEDLKNWTSITLPDYFCTNLTCSFWTKDGRGYYAKDESMMATLDGGKTFQDIVIPEAEEITERLGFNPLIQWKRCRRRRDPLRSCGTGGRRRLCEGRKAEGGIVSVGRREYVFIC